MPASFHSRSQQDETKGTLKTGISETGAPKG